MTEIMVGCKTYTYKELRMHACHNVTHLEMVSLSSFLMLGLLGSSHCLGMCAPLTFFVSRGSHKLWLSTLLYQLGRLLSYLSIVASLHFVGATFLEGVHVSRFSKALSLLALGFMAYQLFRSAIGKKWEQGFIRQIHWVLKKVEHPYRSGMMGLLTGLLPCGLLIPAYTGAVSLELKYSLVAIILFFLGTLPGLFFGIHFLQWLKKKLSLRWSSYLEPAIACHFLVFQCWMFYKHQ